MWGGGEKRGQEPGFLRWQEVGKKGGNYATLHNFAIKKKKQGREATKIGQEPGLKGTGKREV